MSKTSWRKSILIEMERHGKSFEDIISCTLSKEELDEEFDDGYGGAYGKPFCLWTKNRVYFPVQYDGSEWVESVSRNPDDKPKGHVGNG